jgi:outer membrane protein OmpA-like peptidoglycan-associated protein
MASSSEDDSQTYFILGLAVGIIALVILLVVGIAIGRGGPAQPAQGPFPTTVSMTSAAPAAGTPAAGAVVVTESVVTVVPDGASIRVEGGIVKFYFATGSADLAPGAAEALAAVIQGVGAGKKAQISGFHDRTGDAAVNEALARRRAEGVRDLLASLGAPAAQVTMEKPQSTEGTGNNAQARRVEVKLVD